MRPRPIRKSEVVTFASPRPRNVPCAALPPPPDLPPAGFAAAAHPRELWLAVHVPGMHMPEMREDPAAERRQAELLQQVATRAQQFTPRVSLVPPDGLLLEVKGSLHLFGGINGIREAVESECAAIAARPVLALAPTPLAALAGARAGKALVVTDPARLVGQIAPLPLAVLRWPEETITRLARMGVRTIGQVLRLPRSGLARRFGSELLTDLDRLTGRMADPRSAFRAPERFRRRCNLLYDLEHHEPLLEALAPLLQELTEFLHTRQCGITQLECLLHHRHAPATRCVLRFAAPVADPRRLNALLGERLTTLCLPEPVRACELRSDEIIPRELPSCSLWQPGEHGGEAGASSSELIEKLRARLGAEAVYGLQVRADHRPESAWGAIDPVSGSCASGRSRAEILQPPWPAFRRPLWLLPVPRLLAESEGLPRHRGPLRLLGEPERIETGWWDGGEVARDYYTALDVRGVRLWLFRERTPPHRWYLHGIFG